MMAHLAFAAALLACLIAVLALYLAVAAHRRLDRLTRGSKADVARAVTEEFQRTRFRPFRGRGGL